MEKLFNNSTIQFLNALGYKEVAIRSFYDKKRKFKNLVRNEKGEIRCNCCGNFFDEKDVYIGIKNKTMPICKKCSCFKKIIPINEMNRWYNLLKFKNEKCGHGIHVAINGRHLDKEVNKVYAHFFEIDEKPLEEQIKIIKKLKIEPSIIVKTRKSYHVYFLIKNGNLKRFREIQQRLAYTFEGDMQKKNESTCMRIPGFYHNKKEPIMVQLVKCNPNLIYTQDELIKKLNLKKLPEISKKRINYVYKEKDKNELINMFISHVSSYIFNDTGTKIQMSCISPTHKDDNPSAVFFKESMFYHCSGCGANMSLKELAEEQNWTDILNYYNNR